MNYRIDFSNLGAKDLELIKKSPLRKRAYKILSILENDPYAPKFEKLSGNLKNACSRRLSRQHRIVYEIREEEKIVNILSMWTHYERF